MPDRQPRELQEGERVGRYTLLRRLGQGGTATVWEAVLHGPEGFRKPVALKVLEHRPDQDSHTLPSEARLGALLHHPNVVGTYDLGVVDDRWYVAMELVRGVTASQLGRGMPLPGSALLPVALQTAAALAHIHELAVDGRVVGLIHRDVKPSNLLVDRTGLVKLADLGIARLQGAMSQISGTPGYMAPEQLEGLEDARADLFSLGATLLALASGRPPFGKGREAAAAIHQVEDRLGDPEFLAPLAEALPGLEQVVRRCLRHDPADRWPDALSLGEALSELRAPPGPGLGELLGRARPDLAGDRRSTAPASVPPSGDAPTIALSVGNLPPPRDRLVGRADERAALRSLVLAGGPPLTLHGLGGAGKTRLALEVARGTAREVAGGSWFVACEEAKDATTLAITVGLALGEKLGDGDPVVVVGQRLAALGRAVVVLDNLEQVAGPAAPVVSAWADAAPQVTLICTSRVALRIRGERLVPVGPLAPGDALALLRERAGRPLADAELAGAPALLAALDHLPLAIELAAARLRLLDLAEVHRRLEHRLKLLSGGDRDRPERQRSLRASLEGSWELLTPWARAALAQLTVFEGGFSLEGAEAALDLEAWPEAPWAMDVIAELADASLLRCAPTTRRFGMLVSVQDFASEKLAPGEREAAELRHGRWLAQFGTPEALEAVFRQGAQARLEALLAERDNLVTAARRAIGRGDAAVAVPCTQAANVSFQLRGPAEATFTLTTEALALPDLSDGQRARLQHDAGYAQKMLRRLTPAAALLGQALESARRAGLKRQESHILSNLGGVHLDAGDLEAAEQRLAEGLEVARAIGDLRMEGVNLDLHALLRSQQGRDGECVDFARRSVERFRQVGHRRSEGVALARLGTALGVLGEFAEGARLLEEALAIHREVGNLRSEHAALQRLAELELTRGALLDAVWRAGASAEVGREIGSPSLTAHALATGAQAKLVLGRLDEAAMALDDARQLVGPEAADSTQIQFLQWRARVALLRRAPDAGDWLERLARLPAPGPRRALELRALSALERGEPAQAWFSALEAEADGAVRGRDRARLELGAAVARTRAGEPPGAFPGLEAFHPSVPDRAETLPWHAELLAAAGDLPAARASLDEAEALANRMDLEPEAPARQRLRLAYEVVAHARG